jgi:hypothetical protein
VKSYFICEFIPCNSVCIDELNIQIAGLGPWGSAGRQSAPAVFSEKSKLKNAGNIKNINPKINKKI